MICRGFKRNFRQFASGFAKNLASYQSRVKSRWGRGERTRTYCGNMSGVVAVNVIAMLTIIQYSKPTGRALQISLSCWKIRPKHVTFNSAKSKIAHYIQEYYSRERPHFPFAPKMGNHLPPICLAWFYGPCRCGHTREQCFL